MLKLYKKLKKKFNLKYDMEPCLDYRYLNVRLNFKFEYRQAHESFILKTNLIIFKTVCYIIYACKNAIFTILFYYSLACSLL